jgi:hypothetical protein
MKSRTLAVVLIALCLAFWIDLALTASRLPDRVATHFGLDGRPNGWMSRFGCVMFTGLTATGLAGVMALVGYNIQRIPPPLINIPHRKFWMAPDRLEATRACIKQFMLWLACCEVVFFAGLHHLMLDANRFSPPKLRTEFLWPLVGAFLLAVLWRVIPMLRRFSKVPG